MPAAASNLQLEDSVIRLPINATHLKAELTYVARALAIDITNEAKNQLIEQIKAKIEEEAETLRTNARFKHLFITKASASVAINEATTALRETSLTKDLKDQRAAAQQEQTGTLSAAQKALEMVNATSDPLPQSESLSVNPSNAGECAKTKASAAAIGASESDLTDLDGSSISDREGESPGKPKTIAAAEQRAKQLHADHDVLDQNPFLDPDSLQAKGVLVKISEYSITGMPASASMQMEIPLSKSQLESMSKGQGLDGSYHLRWSEIVPAILERGSPIKNNGGRLYRQNKRGLMELANLEHPVTASEIREGKLAGLAKFDKCRLEYLSDEDTYGAHLLWERGAIKKTNALVKVKREDHDGEVQSKVAEGTGSKQEPILVGDASDDSVVYLGEVPAIKKKAGEKDHLITWLRGLLRNDAEIAIPDDSGFWDRSNDYRARAKVLNEGLKWLKDNHYGKKGGGYRIPDNVEPKGLAGAEFLKEDVYTAMHIGHSNAGYIRRALRTENLEKVPALMQWYNGEDNNRYDLAKNLSELWRLVAEDLKDSGSSHAADGSKKCSRSTKKSGDKERGKGKSKIVDESTSSDSEGRRRSRKSRRRESPSSSEIDK